MIFYVIYFYIFDINLAILLAALPYGLDDWAIDQDSFKMYRLNDT